MLVEWLPRPVAVQLLRLRSLPSSYSFLAIQTLEKTYHDGCNCQCCCQHWQLVSGPSAELCGGHPNCLAQLPVRLALFPMGLTRRTPSWLPFVRAHRGFSILSVFLSFFSLLFFSLSSLFFLFFLLPSFLLKLHKHRINLPPKTKNARTIQGQREK
jgi:hypothetical protein